MIIASGEKGTIPIDIDKTKYSLVKHYEESHEKYLRQEKAFVNTSIVSSIPFIYPHLYAQIFGLFTSSFTLTFLYSARKYRKNLESLKQEILELEKDGYIDPQILEDKNITPSLITDLYYKDFPYDNPIYLSSIKLVDKIHVLPFMSKEFLWELDGESALINTEIVGHDETNIICPENSEPRLDDSNPNCFSNGFDTKFYHIGNEYSFFSGSRIKKHLNRNLDDAVRNKKEIIIGGKILDGKFYTDSYWFDKNTRFEKLIKPKIPLSKRFSKFLWEKEFYPK